MADIRDIVEADFEDIIRLNDAEVQQTSLMDRERLRLLVRISGFRKVALIRGEIAAFLLAIREGAPYDNDNYSWFASRFSRFLYVDRIVVGAKFAGHRIGSALYDGLFQYAHDRGAEVITCEYNIDPPNPASRAFHDKFGFKELGTQWVANGTKKVSLQAAKTRRPLDSE